MRSQRVKLVIFSSIGVFNTLFDIVIYTVILDINHSIVIANVVSTSLALIGSYFLNSRLTFKNKHWTKRNFALFVVVTLFGLWVLQTIIIYLITHFLDGVTPSNWRAFGYFSHVAQQVLPKLLATGITFVWNYEWYSKVIFRAEPKQDKALLALDNL